ncbi:phage tail tape measure protein [Jiella sp. MQZ9-1]|uniref:Phage tail tape measure protein n=1 Tax=Jiella flava TaxID=2816857 RepID=A0A939FTU5_9HYPH|nr:phage tail tape measure protein [Jiella flava]MBO0661838.1 phage tail tape measure protein [Jiella flava]MCD2470478.1 phage tail tape measure protein [Jiella flava]
MHDDETFTVAVKADTSGVDRALGDLSKQATRFGHTLTSAFAEAVTGSRSLDGVLKHLGESLSKLALEAALKPLGELASNLFRQLFSMLGSSLGSGLGGGLGGGGLSSVHFAKGGVVAAPQYFATDGRVGLMGEAGAEAILPLRRGADGSLGVAAPGGSSAPNIVFNVKTPDAPSFTRAEAQIQAMLTRAALRGRRSL